MRRTAAFLTAGLAILAAFSAQETEDKPPIRIGLLEDQSGEIALFTMLKVRGTELAVEEINKAGGIMGRQLELIAYDPQFDNAKFQEFTRRLWSATRSTSCSPGRPAPRARRSGRSSTAPTPSTSTPISMKAASATAT